MKIGIVGLTNAGKSTLFTALTRVKVPINNFPFCTIDPNVGIVPVPDFRVEKIAQITKPERKVYATVEFVDVAGLVRGASRGEGLGNQFLAKMREMDLLVLVIRAFPDPEVVHVEGDVQPLRDLDLVLTELALSDLEILSRRLSYLEKVPRGSTSQVQELNALKEVKALLERGDFQGLSRISGDIRNSLGGFGFLTLKPMVVLFNLSEGQLQNQEETERLLGEFNVRFPFLKGLKACALLEKDLWELSPEERQEYLKELKIERSSLEELILASYRMLQLITFFTIQSSEVRAWSVPEGTRAQNAAGKIHTDMERGFIKAEVVFWEELVRAGGWVSAKEKGFLRLEGKDYKVQDGDVILFKFQA
ncbi:MAG: redox-regulated ATPase YchF [Caldiserica bacterium]|jgi:GTP-binding protein YchF|nr:redox-regulated ATPase YchF [Caldisericota bacterium]MDH7562793.1 redox-regulated ATPase YchF [Caldisericota bacterium]